MATKAKPKAEPKAEPKAKPKFKRKCKLCGQYITDEADAEEYKGGYVHANCLAASVTAVQEHRADLEKKREAKKKESKPGTPEYIVPKEGLSEEEYAEKLDFFDTLKDILHVQRLPAKVYAMASHLTEKYRYFTYSGMKETLLYCQHTLERKLTENCMGLIPYYYDEAMAELERIRQNQQNAEATLDQLTTETEVVTIPKPSGNNKDFINIEEIG